MMAILRALGTPYTLTLLRSYSNAFQELIEVDGAVTVGVEVLHNGLCTISTPSNTASSGPVSFTPRSLRPVLNSSLSALRFPSTESMQRKAMPNDRTVVVPRLFSPSRSLANTIIGLR